MKNNELGFSCEDTFVFYVDDDEPIKGTLSEIIDTWITIDHHDELWTHFLLEMAHTSALDYEKAQKKQGKPYSVEQYVSALLGKDCKLKTLSMILKMQKELLKDHRTLLTYLYKSGKSLVEAPFTYACSNVILLKVKDLGLFLDVDAVVSQYQNICSSSSKPKAIINVLMGGIESEDIEIKLKATIKLVALIVFIFIDEYGDVPDPTSIYYKAFYNNYMENSFKYNGKSLKKCLSENQINQDKSNLCDVFCTICHKINSGEIVSS